MRHTRGCAFAVKIKQIGDEAALLEQILAARKIIHPRRALFPPSIRTLKVDAPRSHAHAGLAIIPRLMRVAMENKAVHAKTKLHVAQAFQTVGIVGPRSDIGGGRERFRGHDGLP